MDLEQAMDTSMVQTKPSRKRNYPVYTRGPYKGKRKYPYGWNSKKYRQFFTNAFPKGSPESRDFWGPTWHEANQVQKLRRGVGRYKGEGDYKSMLRNIAKYGIRAGYAGYGAMKGFGSGGVPGALSAAAGGWQQGAMTSKYLGLGDYATHNQIISGAPTMDQQQISVNQHSLTGDIHYSNTEFVGNVTVTVSGSGTSGFSIQSYDINPGLQTFPFLSQIANNFELYDWEGLIFQYKPNSGEFGASSVSNSLGKVIMATRYGVNQTTPFTSAIDMQNYDYAQSTKPSCGMIHGVETANHQQVTEMNLIRDGEPTESRILYDIGKLYVATEGIPHNGSGTIVLGELWVTYKVKLSRAKLHQALGEAHLYGGVGILAEPNDILPLQYVITDKIYGDFKFSLERTGSPTACFRAVFKDLVPGHRYLFYVSCAENQGNLDYSNESGMSGQRNINVSRPSLLLLSFVASSNVGGLDICRATVSNGGLFTIALSEVKNDFGDWALAN